VLAKARQAIYTADAVKPIPAALLRKYLLRGRDPERRQFRVVPELRSLVNFRRLNLMDDDFGVPEPMDVIFCRNVLIYFERAIQLRLITRFVQLLRPGGFLFLGHSESINGFDLPLQLSGPTVYKKTEEDGLSRDLQPRGA
jgi:chemotaxis protein methyltransferase CheR